MRKTSISSNGHSWDELHMLLVKTEIGLDAEKLAKEIRSRLSRFRTARGISITHTERERELVVAYPTQMLEGKQLTNDIVLGMMESIENDILKALHIQDIVSIAL